MFNTYDKKTLLIIYYLFNDTHNPSQNAYNSAEVWTLSSDFEIMLSDGAHREVLWIFKQNF